jgi:preprotein translocase subunit SecB
MATAQIESIRLVDSRARHRLAIASKPNALNVGVTTKSGGAVEGQKNLRILAQYSLVAKRTAEKAPAVDVRVSFELLYRIPPDLKPSDIEIKAFSATNAMLNSWPYFREFVQSMIARMNLPPLTLPLYRILQAKPTVERKESAKAS